MAYNMESVMPGWLFPNRGPGLRTRTLPRYTSKTSAATALAASPDEAWLGLSSLELLTAGMLSAAIIALGIVWYFDLSRPVTCRPAPLVFQIGSAADTQMTVRAGAQCAVYVLPGHAALDEPVTTLAPLHGAIAPRGHIGVDYRPDAGFTGDDFFAVAMNGKAGQKAGAMAIRVHVTVR